ncbi:MAG TPA: hypothetical protein VMM79_10285 [Longimicrobiales bacterium]|nr:hypothetical protein [Longimicrobiales bacterium]
MSSRARPAFLQDAYRDMPDADFCRGLLMAADDLWVHVWPSVLGWSDLGTPERLRTWLARATRTAPVRHARMPGPRARVNIQAESA